MDGPTAGTAVQKIVELLTDAELPVRIFATTSLAAVMDDDNVKLMLRPHVNILLNALFTIIQQVASEETMSTLATIIKCAGSVLCSEFLLSHIFKAISRRNSSAFCHAHSRLGPNVGASC
jgi:hydrogenase maturation factor HypF (carbamoyltransferase family)